MTQIKLRRDTSANFTSKNPVLGLGEPAYEIDTKKLKIGDGTTAYTQLEYFSAGGGGSADIGAALPLKIVNGVISIEVDGQTIQVVDGKLAASANMVTTDTTQNISGQKEFDKTILFLGNNDLLRAQQSTSYRNGAGLSMGANSTSTDGGVFAPQWKIYNTAGDVDRTETIITTYNQSQLNSSNFNTANKLVRLGSDGKLPAVDGSNLTNLPGGLELNNPYSLFDSKYSDHELNNLSWLKSEGQWNAKAVYTDAYDELLREYNDSTSVEETEGSITFKRTPKGYKIALADQEAAIGTKYTTDGIAWYYILDTANEKFKLPRTKFGFEGLRTSVGDDIKAGLPNITGYGTGNAIPNTEETTYYGALYKYTSGGSYGNTLKDNYNRYNIGLDASRSNPIYGNSNTVQPPATQMYLYFYVGETVQNANLIDAGRIGEQLAGKADKNEVTPLKTSYIVDTYVNGTSGYRLYSDKWCEQWGYKSGVNAETITFLKAFKDTNYNIVMATEKASIYFQGNYRNKTTTSMNIDYTGGTGGSALGTSWRVSGYIA